MKPESTSVILRLSTALFLSLLIFNSCRSIDSASLESVSPAMTTRGDDALLTLRGSNFDAAATRDVHCGGGTVRIEDDFQVRLLSRDGAHAVLIEDVAIENENTITGTLTGSAALTVPAGSYDVELTSPTGDIDILNDAIQLTDGPVDSDSTADSDSHADSDTDSVSDSGTGADSDTGIDSDTTSDTISGSTLIADRASVVHVINGTFDSGTWNFTPVALKSIDGCNSDNTVLFSAQWDDTYLYLAAQVTDARIWRDSVQWYDDDAVEIFIDGDHNAGAVYDTHDNQYVRTLSSTALFCKQNAPCNNVLSAQIETPTGYNLEMAIPWTDLGVTPAENATLGLELFIDDDDDGGIRDCILVWSGDDAAWQDTRLFGDVILGPLP